LHYFEEYSLGADEEAHPRIPLSRCRLTLKPPSRKEGVGEVDSLKERGYNKNKANPTPLKDRGKTKKFLA